MMYKAILALLVAILGVLCYLLYVNYNLQRQFSPEFSIIENAKKAGSKNPQKIISYRIITPVANQANSVLFLKTDGGDSSTVRITPAQTSAIISLLKEKEVLYNTNTASLILTVDFTKLDSIPKNQNQ